jgi:hypothetical protein
MNGMNLKQATSVYISTLVDNYFDTVLAEHGPHYASFPDEECQKETAPC